MEKSELTALELAKKSGISKRSINRIMNMKDIGNISLGTLVKLSIALKCKPRDLFSRE